MKKCIITVFFLVDNFCKIFENWEKNNLLPSIKTRQRAGNLTLSELLSIVLFFYLSPCRDFKNYYIYYLPSKYPNYFKLVSYSRIVQLWQRLILPISIIMYMLTGEHTGIYFVDSTKRSDSSWIATATAFSFSAYSLPWCAQNINSPPVARVARTYA